MTGFISPLTAPTKPFKFLLIALGAGGLISGVLFRYIVPWLALSLPTIQEGYFWQLISYAFVLNGPIGFGSALDLVFDLLMFWVFGSAIIERKGHRSFFILFFGATLFAGAMSLIAMIGTPFFLFGPTPTLFAILITWLMLNRDAQIWFLVTLKATWAICGIIAIDLLIHLSQGAWIPLFANASGALFGFLFITIPVVMQRKAKLYHHSKIIDIQTGKPVLDDEQFMDAMLARISLYGEASLTPEEKKRMLKISETKKKPSK